MVADTTIFFTPVEKATRTLFLPALLDLPAVAIDGSLHVLLSNGVKQAGLGIRNPVETALYVHAASKSV